MSDVAAAAGLSGRTRAAIQDVLAGRRRAGSALLFAGPAVIASIAYMDPGNFATNLAAGSRFGYRLLWVVVAANLIAMLFQTLSAKLGIATGRNLAELCRAHFRPPVVWALWGISETAAMATDLAEFLGGAIGFALLLQVPLPAGMALTAAATYAVLIADKRGFRPVEIAIGALAGVIALCGAVELLAAPVAWKAAGLHAIVPQLPGTAAVTVSVGIVGATVMPHAVFLHSGLTQRRAPAASGRERRLLVRFSNREVLIALSLAGLVNLAMVAMAAGAFHAGRHEVTDIATAFRRLTPLLGGVAAAAFLASLIASGISSSAVGTMAGQMIMQGFVGFAIPVWLRRLVTMAPAFVIVGLGVNTAAAMVMSQAVLCLALPAAAIPLVLLTRRRDIMGDLANGPLTDVAAITAAALVLALNVVLLASLAPAL